MSTKKWIRHTIKCRCVLSQFANRKNPPFHEFIVFSSYKDDENLEHKFVQCNNCGVVHEITGVCTSKILNKDDLYSIRTLEDIKLSIPEKLCSVLERYKLEINQFEAAEFIIENELWGDRIILTKDVVDNQIQIKYLTILGKNLFKIDNISSIQSI